MSDKPSNDNRECVILVGRHVGDIPGVEVVEQRNIEWALNLSDCLRQLGALQIDATIMGASILFQNIPGALAAALIYFEKSATEENCDPCGARMGTVISRSVSPFEFDHIEWF